MRKTDSLKQLVTVVRSEPQFRRLFLAQTTSLVGDMMAPVAVTFALLANGTATDVAVVFAAEALAATFVLLFGGAIADRAVRRDVLIITDCIRGASQATAAWIVLSGHAGPATLAPFAVINGCSMAAFRPALTAMIPEAVASEHLTAANSALGLAASAGTLIGPALAGAIVAAANPGWAIALDALTYGISALLVFPLPRISHPDLAADGLKSEIASGWRFVRNTPWILSMIVYAGIFQAAPLSALYVLGPLVAKEHFGGALGWSAMLAALGLGSIIGGFVAVTSKPRTPLLAAVSGMLAFAVALASLIPPLPLPILIVEMLLSGTALTVFDAWWLTALQTHVPAELLGKVSSFDWFGSIALRPAGLVAAGVLSAALGVPLTIAGAASILLAATLITLTVPGIRTFRLPSSSVAPSGA